MAKAKKAAKKKPAAKKPAKKAAAKKPAKKAAAKKPAKKAAKPAKKAAKPAKKKSARKPNAAFMKPLTPSATLAAVIGNKPAPRTEVVKQIWNYIKKHGLQDKKNRRMINADDKLKAVFGGKSQISMFELAKVLSKHVK
ncbi:MAG TPA: SWIB/MDM2 domain-containing protein [Flavobacteriales bacterium]|nr:SWIB/MDM2 domain-containing protein [Flavobacteriales bacterium]